MEFYGREKWKLCSAVIIYTVYIYIYIYVYVYIYMHVSVSYSYSYLDLFPAFIMLAKLVKYSWRGFDFWLMPCNVPSLELFDGKMC